MSPDCKNKKEVHKENSTRGNTTKGMTFNEGWDELYCGVVVDKLVNLNLKSIIYRSPTPIPTSDTAISDASVRGLYLSAYAPHSENNPSAPTIIVGTFTGHIQKYISICRTLPTHLPNNLNEGHLLPTSATH